MEYYLGLDMGTTNIKAALFSADGTLSAYHSELTPIVHPREGFSEFNPMELWRTASRCIRGITAAIPAQYIVSIGISSLAESGLLAQEDGTPLSNIIAWYDTRAKKEIKQLLERVEYNRVYAITGQIPSDKYGICKLMWLKNNEQEAYAKAKHWLSVEDWIIFCLTGEFATDYSIASRTMAFDINNRAWSKEILQVADIPSSLFSPVYPGGTCIGKVTEAAAQETGLLNGTCVSTGGHDHACASIAVNIFEEGVVLDSMGTAEVSMIAVPEPVLNEETLRRYYSVYPHCGKKLYRVLTSNQCCGASIEWYLNTFGKDITEEAGRLGISKYDCMLDKIKNDFSGVGKLYFLPFLRGTIERSNMRGVFFGVDDSHRQGNFIQAIIEGICYELRNQIDGYSATFGRIYNKLRVVGGLSKSDTIMRQKSLIQQSLVEVPGCNEAACFGAALLGAIGAKKLKFEDLHAMYHAGKQYHFEDALTSRSDYQNYLKIRMSIKDIYEAMDTGQEEKN